MRIPLVLQRPRLLVVGVNMKAYPRRPQGTQVHCLPACVSQADAGPLQDPDHDAGDSGSERAKTVAEVGAEEAHRTAHGQTPSVAVRTLDRRPQEAADKGLLVVR